MHQATDTSLAPLTLPAGHTLLLQLRAGDELFCQRGSATLHYAVAQVAVQRTLSIGQAWRCATGGNVQVCLSRDACVLLQPMPQAAAARPMQRRSPLLGALRRVWLEAGWFRRVRLAASWKTP